MAENSEIDQQLPKSQEKKAIAYRYKQSNYYRVFKLCQTSNHSLGIKNTLLSHKNAICTFMRSGNLIYDTWIWLKITSLSSTASVLNDSRILLEIPSFCSEFFFVQNIKIRFVTEATQFCITADSTLI